MMLVGATLTGCTELDSFHIDPDPPSDVRLVYAAAQDEDGNIEVTALEPWPSAKLELNGRAGLSRWLIGYSAPPKMVEAAVHQPLRSVNLCEPALPPGNWCQIIGDDPSSEPEPCTAEGRPPVTFDGLEAFRRCTDALAVRVSCGGQQVDCAWTLSGADCSYRVMSCAPFSHFGVEFDGIARACATEVPPECSAAEAAGALTALSCPGTDGPCIAEIHSVPEAAWLTVERRISLVEGEARTPEAVTEGSRVSWDTVHAGYVYDAAAADGLLYVALPSMGSGLVWWDPNDFPQPGTLLRVLDPEGNVLGESVIMAEPTIALELIADEVIALMGGGPSQRTWLRRFDREGRMISENAIETSQLALPAPFRRAALASNGQRLFLSLGGRTPAPIQSASVLFELDPTTLSTVAMARFPAQPGGSDARRLWALAISGDRILAEDEHKKTHVWLDTSTFERLEEVAMAEGGTDDASIFSSGDRAIAARLGLRRAGLDVVEYGRSSVDRIARFEVPGPASAVGPWPGNERWASAASLHGYEAHIGPVDLAESAVLLGATPIGWGPVSRIRSDGSDGLWALLPWAGELVRLTLP